MTSRESSKLAYGALRSVFIGLEPLQRRSLDPKKILTDKRINEPIRRAFGYMEFMKKARQKTRRLRTLAAGIENDMSDMDVLLKQCFKEFQQRIDKAIQEINSEASSTN